MQPERWCRRRELNPHPPHGGPDFEWWGFGVRQCLKVRECAARSKVLGGSDALPCLVVLRNAEASRRQYVGKAPLVVGGPTVASSARRVSHLPSGTQAHHSSIVPTF